jgi:hypothetical protein
MIVIMRRRELHLSLMFLCRRRMTGTMLPTRPGWLV